MKSVFAGVLAFAAACCAGSAGAEPPASERAVRGERASLAYQRFKSLEGRWHGRSTKGWTDEAEVQVVAGGSAVAHFSFEAHPGQQMITMIHPDGDRLLLTHYCVAGNQPRLVATDVDEDARRVVFELLDATNLASRDAGHMDSVIFTFESDDRHRSQWTWYQDGQERWMEEIHHERVAGTAARARATSRSPSLGR